MSYYDHARLGSSVYSHDFLRPGPSVNITKDETVADDGALTHHEEADDSEPEKDDADTILPSTPFLPVQCLFCPVASPKFELNQSHMHKHHGLFLPLTIDDGARALAVEMETLVEYMHLVIFGYHECLFCGTQRQSAHAVQQHMVGKGHCRINLDDGEVGKEFRDFYEVVEVEEDEDEVGSLDGQSASEGESSTSANKRSQARNRSATPSKLDDNTLRLSSGKILSHRSTPPPTKANRRPLAEPKGHGRRAHDRILEDLIADPEPSPTPGAGSDAQAHHTSQDSKSASASLTRIERRALAHSKSALGVAVAKMSTRDRAALAHLSPAEQRGVIVRQFKQQDRLAHEQRKYWGKVETRPNKSKGRPKA